MFPFPLPRDKGKLGLIKSVIQKAGKFFILIISHFLQSNSSPKSIKLAVFRHVATWPFQILLSSAVKPADYCISNITSYINIIT